MRKRGNTPIRGHSGSHPKNSSYSISSERQVPRFLSGINCRPLPLFRGRPRWWAGFCVAAVFATRGFAEVQYAGTRPTSVNGTRLGYERAKCRLLEETHETARSTLAYSRRTSHG